MAKLRTKKDAKGVLEPEEEVPNHLAILACKKSNVALIVVRQRLDTPPEGDSQ